MISTSRSVPTMRTAKLFTPSRAGGAQTAPVLTLKWAPCHGQITSSPTSLPSAKGPPPNRLHELHQRCGRAPFRSPPVYLQPLSAECQLLPKRERACFFIDKGCAGDVLFWRAFVSLSLLHQG